MEFIDFLLKNGAKPGKLSNDIMLPTPIHAAVKNQTPKGMSVLRKLLDYTNIVGIQGIRGRTALHFAARYANHKAIPTLVASGWNLNAKDDGGDTPLHTAVKLNNINEATALIETSPTNSINLQNNAYETPLNVAIKMGHAAIADVILGLGTNFSLDAHVNGNGDTPFHLLAKIDGDDDDLVELIDLIIYLRKAGFQLNYLNKRQQTPLIVAVINEKFYVTKAFLKIKLNYKDDYGSKIIAINTGDEDGNTALHHAVLKGDLSTVRLLYDNGARTDLLNNNRQTPLDLARYTGAGDIISFFTDNGVYD